MQSKRKGDIELFRHVLPEDMVKFGLIPEFIGRLPIVGAVQQLDRDMLIQRSHRAEELTGQAVSTSARHGRCGVGHRADALEAIADLALERGTGARGLRSILEHVLLEPMYDVPGRSDVVKCVVTASSVRLHEAPNYEMRKATRTRRAS